MRKTIYQGKYRELLGWLAAAREARGLSIRELGDLLGRPNSYVTKTELGERRLDVFEFVQYCKALEVDPVIGLRMLD